PAARLAFMLRDAGASVLLTHESFRTTLPESELVTVCLDSQRHLFDGPPSEVPEPGITAQNAAYVIYTSGSTGQPRGGVVPHINLVRIAMAWNDVYELAGHAACYLQMASMSFDVFTGDLVRGLCLGGRLVICPHEILMSPEQLYDLMLRERVDSAEFVPA